jgi:hypothetical protein
MLRSYFFPSELLHAVQADALEGLLQNPSEVTSSEIVDGALHSWVSTSLNNRFVLVILHCMSVQLQYCSTFVLAPSPLSKAEIYICISL